MTGELASALRTLHISTFHDLVGVSLRDLQRVSDKSAALFLELSRLIKLAAAGRAASVSNRGTGVDRERTTSARPCGSSDKQTGLPKHLIAVLPFAQPSSRSAPDWSVSSIHPNSDASSRQPVHPPEDFVVGVNPRIPLGQAITTEMIGWPIEFYSGFGARSFPANTDRFRPAVECGWTTGATLARRFAR